MTENPPRAANLEAGYDDENPYEGEDISTYPTWWHENIKEFRRYEMRPYRPPRFSDGELVPPVMTELQEELGVEIRLRATDPAVGENWELHVDGTKITEVGRSREGEGFTEYSMDSETFEITVRSAVE
jgi:hypothetical protein